MEICQSMAVLPILGYATPMTSPADDVRQQILRSIRRDRLIGSAVRLMNAQSPTGQAGPALDALADLLQNEGFTVDRPEAGHPHAPAVVMRLAGTSPGRTLQFDGHLDTVHLPYVVPRVARDLLSGTGASDMKAGVAAAVEAILALRDSGLLTDGAVLLTAHDLHEAPWGFGQQLDQMISDGILGDAVLIPESLRDHLPVAGRGQACWKVTFRRMGAPVHEVMRPTGEPDVIAAAAEFACRLSRLDQRLAGEGESLAGRASVFIGQVHGGVIYNGFSQDCWLEGTRRWLPGAARDSVEAEFRAIATEIADESDAIVDIDYQLVRDAFTLDQADPLVICFQRAHEATTGHALPIGPKPFVDDGNCFSASAGIAAITHGPKAGGQHTLGEWVSIDDLERVARCYALTALHYCAENAGGS
jgi:succinyl-diaminopimelate desuccinylase